jgi:hypothetical protein
VDSGPFSPPVSRSVPRRFLRRIGGQTSSDSSFAVEILLRGIGHCARYVSMSICLRQRNWLPGPATSFHMVGIDASTPFSASFLGRSRTETGRCHHLRTTRPTRESGSVDHFRRGPTRRLSKIYCCFALNIGAVFRRYL